MDSSAMLRTPSLAPVHIPPPVIEDDFGAVLSPSLIGPLSRQATEHSSPPEPQSIGASQTCLECVGIPSHLSVSAMVIALLRLQASATATTVLYFCNQAITMMFVGQYIGTEGLAYFSVGTSVFNIAGLSVGIGMATALDTLVSQAYGRNGGSTPEVGVLLQRSFVVCWAMMVPIVWIFFHAEPLLGVVFDTKLAAGIHEFLMASPMYLFLLITNFCLQKTLQAQQFTELPVYANAASAVACPLLNYVLTPRGVPYAVLAATLSVGVAVAVMAAGAAFHPRSVINKASWPAAAAFSPRGLWAFLRVGLPGLASVASEWWAFEVIIAFSSRYGENVVTAFTISMSIVTFMFAIPSGLSVAAGVLCGNHLGMNDPRGARAFALIAIVLGLVGMSLTNAGLVVFGETVFRLYTRDEGVLSLVRGVIYLLALFHFCDATQTILQGIFRSAGRQAMSARIVIASLWLVGLPASWYLGAHSDSPLEGIIWGLIIGFGFEIPLLYVDMLRSWDWQAMALLASKQGGECDALAGGPSKVSYGATADREG